MCVCVCVCVCVMFSIYPALGFVNAFLDPGFVGQDSYIHVEMHNHYAIFCMGNQR